MSRKWSLMRGGAWGGELGAVIALIVGWLNDYSWTETIGGAVAMAVLGALLFVAVGLVRNILVG